MQATKYVVLQAVKEIFKQAVKIVSCKQGGFYELQDPDRNILALEKYFKISICSNKTVIIFNC